ncbi:hypothetical protein JCM3765_003858 [Sporobolomyces pararoseus]
MSLESLPNELQNLIFSSIHPKTSSPTLDSQKAFCSLALTSKRFLPLAREYLYSQPLSNARISWRKAKALSWTLQHTSHGQLVSSLESIPHWWAKLDASASSESNLPFQLAGFSKANSWYFTTVEVCTRLRTIGFFAITPRTASRLIKALEPSSVSLRSAAFGNPRSASSQHMSSRQIYNALQNPLFLNLERIFIGEFASSGSSLNLLPPGSIPDLKEVVLQIHAWQLEQVKPLLPSNPFSLTKFVMLTTTRTTTEDLLWILDYIPSTLRTLRI